MNIKDVINEEQIRYILNNAVNPAQEQVLNVLNKALLKKGLNLEETAILINTDSKELSDKIFECALKIKNEIYGERLVLFAPLYVSNYCINSCDYCGFNKNNPTDRKKLSLDEVRQQTELLIKMGHKRLLLEFGEDPNMCPIDYVVDVIKTIYKTKVGNGEIRRVNVNISATSVEDYKKLKSAGIGTYQLFQETYHRETYEKYHHGPKSNYERQLFAHDRAFKAGLDDLGLGVLFGLYDWKFEILALISHSLYLDKKYGIGPHTISIPRIRPTGNFNINTPYKVSDSDLLKIIAILRIAVPYTGMIISTRETPEIRSKAFKLGISQTSAGSRTAPGAYGNGEKKGQFQINDLRTADQVIESILKQGLLPSYCTACYRKGRTGHAFMDLAKPGDIHTLCLPNAILTFKEYIEDYASEDVKHMGGKVIQKYLDQIENEQLKKQTVKKVCEIENGQRDLFF